MFPWHVAGPNLVPMIRAADCAFYTILFQFFLHGSDLSSLHTSLPRNILPKEYGGTAGELDTASWNSVLLASEDDFVKEFCQPESGCDGLLGQPLLPEGLISDAQCDDSMRAMKSQLYSCY